jgi:hypothetical protein
MNWEIIWTAVGLGVAGIFILPFYMALYVAVEKSRSKINLEFLATANQIDKKMEFDDAVERLFDGGEQK